MDRIPEANKFLSDGSGMTQEFSRDGNNWTMLTSTDKGGREFKFTLGQETDSVTLDGRPIKVSRKPIFLTILHSLISDDDCMCGHCKPCWPSFPFWAPSVNPEQMSMLVYRIDSKKCNINKSENLHV